MFHMDKTTVLNFGSTSKPARCVWQVNMLAILKGMKEAQLPWLAHVFKNLSRCSFDQCQSMKLVIAGKDTLGLQLFLYPRLDPKLQVEVESIWKDPAKVLASAECRLSNFICVKISLYLSLYHLGLNNLRGIRRCPWKMMRYGTEFLDIPVILKYNWQDTPQDDATPQNEAEPSWWDHLQIIG